MELLEESELRFFALRAEVPRRSDLIFYNPAMRFSRNITVGVAELTKPRSFCDVLAGCGVRGLRVAKEVGCERLILNDKNKTAREVMGKNAKLNGIAAEVYNEEANLLLERLRSLDFVDVDPFGSPVPFLTSALRAVRAGGVLAVTATDLAALKGRSPCACFRKYSANPIRVDYSDELGLRILMGCVARRGLELERGVEPLLCYSRGHFLRCYSRVERGSKAVNRTLEAVAYLWHCPSCAERGYAPLEELKERCDCGSKLWLAGPLWGEEFASPNFCEKLTEVLAARGFREEAELVRSVGLEQGVRKPYFSIHALSKLLRKSCVSVDASIRKLREKGYLAVRTHFSPVGLRTDAPASVVKLLWDELL